MYQVCINKVNGNTDGFNISHVSHTFYLASSVEVCKLIEMLSSQRYFISLCELTLDDLDDVISKIESFK